MSTIIYVIVTVLTIFVYKFVIWFRKKQEFFKKIQNIPGPKQKFLFGNALDFKSADDFLLKLFQYQKENGLTYQMQLGLDSFVVTADPKLIECITTSTTQITKTSIYKFLANWVGDGLISASNPRWKLHRRLITPTFHFNILKDFVPVFYKNAHNLIDHWKSSLGKEFDAYEDVLACTLDIICETAMGISVNALRDGKHSNYLESVKFQGRCIMERSFSFWKQIDALYKLSPTYKKEMEMIRNIKKTTEEVIRRKKEEINNKVEKKNQFEDGDDLGMKPKSAFLDHLMTSIEQNNGLMSEEDLRDEVDTFIFAGHETTASSLSFALYFLAKHQDVQQKVYDEVVQVLDGGEEISNEKLPNLKYLDMVIKETLRVMPSVPVYFRMLTEDVNYNGQVFPKNLNLVLFAYGAHRNEEFFDNPEEFRPERFSSEAVSKRNTFAYVPFSAGPRNCIGQKFALIEMKCLLSALIKEFKFTKSPNFSIQPAVLGVAKSVNGVHLIIESRNN